MAEGSGKAREIDLGHDFGDVVVRANGAQVTIGANGSLHGLPAPANDTARAKTAPEPGHEMEDGTILAGYYEGKPLYATPADDQLTMRWEQAIEYAAKLDAHSHKDWRVPTQGELNVLWENRNKGKLKGTFNETGSLPAGWYWSSSQLDLDNAWAQRFSDGSQGHFDHYSGNYNSSLRCVRG